MSMLPYDSKVCRMMLTSRMVLGEEQQKFVCEGKKFNIYRFTKIYRISLSFTDFLIYLEIIQNITKYDWNLDWTVLNGIFSYNICIIIISN